MLYGHINRINKNGRTIPEDPVTKKGKSQDLPFFFYPSQAKQSGSIAFAAISPRNTDSVRI